MVKKISEIEEKMKRKKFFSLSLVSRNFLEGFKQISKNKNEKMELGGSCVQLNEIIQERKLYNRKISTNNTEKRGSIKKYFPQVIATFVSSLMNLGIGMSMTYSAILIAQIKSPDSDIKVTTNEITWIASVFMITTPIGCISGGFIMDKIGRLNTLKLSIVPFCLGWIVTATAYNVPMILIGRMASGLAGAWGVNPTIVFTAEISSPELRGSLCLIGACFVNLGMALPYLIGWIIHWRLLAWLANIIAVISGIGLLLIPESPSWLIRKGEVIRAKKSLEWYYKHYPYTLNNCQTAADTQLEILVKKNNETVQEHKKKERKGLKIILHEFLKPTGYKPFLIMTGLFCFQQFTGIYVVLFYAVSFNAEIGADIDPYLTSTISGFFRFVITVALVFLLKKFSRRGLLITSAILMAVFIGLSGLFTSLLKEGKTSMTWIPVVCNFIYCGAAAFGISSLPWSLSAEVFPLEIRGVAQSCSMTLGHTFMFIVTKTYFLFKDLLGGIVGVQYFYAMMSLSAAIYVFIFLPETKDKKLSEIEEYFSRHTVYLGEKTIRAEIRRNKRENNNALKISEQTETEKMMENV